MSDDTPNGVAQAPNVETGIEDLDKTPSQGVSPNEAETSGGWQMPTPVFRQTSGYLPEGFEKQFGMAEQAQPVGEANTETPAPVPIEELPAEVELPAPASAALDIEPQPDVIAELELVEDIAAPTAPPVNKKGVFGRIILTIFALIVVAALTLIFAAVVWYLLTPLPESTIN